MRKATLLLFVFVIALTPALYAGKKPTAPGTYKKWGPNIDLLEVLQTFKAADYTKIVVEPIDTTDTPMPDKDDNSYESAKKVLANAAEPFTIGLKSRITKDVEKSDVSPAPAAPGTLIVRAKISKADPGSRAARYWGGFGAGATQTQMTGEILDGATGAVLLRFTQERWGSGGWFGGGYEALMNSNLRQIGRDVAAVIKAF